MAEYSQDIRKHCRASAGLLALVWVAACSDSTEPNRPPAASGSIPPQSLEAGESATLDIAGFFGDPDGDELTYTSESTHAGQATASMSGSNLTIAGIGEGDPSVTVTATDPGDLLAALSTQVSVRLPNRAPEAVGSVPPVSVGEERPFDLDVLWYFRDPDRDHLEYSAVSSDANVAAVEVSGSVVRFTAVTSGVTTVAVTATDPGGLSATQEIQVQSAVGPPGFRDDFDSDEFLGWELVQAGAELSEGVLQLTNTGAGMPGRTARVWGRDLTNWQADIRLGRAQEDATARVVFHNPTAEFPMFAVDIGSGVSLQGQDTNFRFLILPQGAPGWQPVFGASSEAIDDGIGEFTEISVAFRDLRIAITVGSDTLFFDNPGAQGAPAELGFLTGLELWVVPLDGANERTALFDWIEVTGMPVAGPPAVDSRAPVAGDRISPATASAATPPRPGAWPQIRSGRWPRPESRD